MKNIAKVFLSLLALVGFTSTSHAGLSEFGQKVMNNFYQFQASIFSCDEKLMNEVFTFPSINKPDPHTSAKDFFLGVKCEKKPENKSNHEFLSEYFSKIVPIKSVDFQGRHFEDKEMANEFMKIKLENYFDMKPGDEVAYFFDKNTGLKFLFIIRNDKFVGTTMVN